MAWRAAVAAAAFAAVAPQLAIAAGWGIGMPSPPAASAEPSRPTGGISAGPSGSASAYVSAAAALVLAADARLLPAQAGSLLIQTAVDSNGSRVGPGVLDPMSVPLLQPPPVPQPSPTLTRSSRHGRGRSLDTELLLVALAVAAAALVFILILWLITSRPRQRTSGLQSWQPDRGSLSPHEPSSWDQPW